LRILSTLLLSILITCIAVDKKSSFNKNDLLQTILKRFNLEQTENTIVKFHTKESLKSKIDSDIYDSLEVEEIIKRVWPSNLKESISLLKQTVRKDSVPNGYYLEFAGDTSYYTFGFYKNGKRDSLWINKSSSKLDTTHYKNGKYHGKMVSYFPNGNLKYKQKWNMGTIVDTSYHYHENGNLFELEVFKDGKSIEHKCFEQDGVTPDECPQ